MKAFFILTLTLILILQVESSIYSVKSCQLNSFSCPSTLCSTAYSSLDTCYKPYFIGDLLDENGNLIRSGAYIYRYNSDNDNLFLTENDAKNWANGYTLGQIYTCYLEPEILYLENRDTSKNEEGFYMILILGIIGASCFLCPIIFCIILILLCLTCCGFSSKKKQIDTEDFEYSNLPNH